MKLPDVLSWGRVALHVAKTLVFPPSQASRNLHRLVARNDVEGVRSLLAQLDQATARKLVNTPDTWKGACLMEAAANPRCGTAMLELLVAHGAELGIVSYLDMPRNALGAALGSGDLDKIRFLVAAGADLHYRRGGYTAAIDAVHGRDILRDAGLLDLLGWLVAQKVDLDAVTSYGESALRVLSRIGRFDAVRLLLDAGADASQLEFSPLHEAVAFGRLEEVRSLLDAGADIEARDRWSRTPLLLAAQCGDLAKLDLLRARGADFRAVGRCGKPLLFYPIEMRRGDVLAALVERGGDIEQADEFGGTVLMAAAEAGNAQAIGLLLAAGAQLDRAKDGQTALSVVVGPEAARCLLEAGADPAFLTREGARVLLGFSAEADEGALDCSAADFAAAATRRFAEANGQEITHPYYLAMIRSGLSAYGAVQALAPNAKGLKAVHTHPGGPVWSANRFGQSMSFLPDGRIVQVGGEHEDSYDPDFCIYNDVFVHHPGGRIQVFGYPEDVFPPTDFHSATVVGDSIYIIGALGYQASRRPGTTPVFRLDLRSLRMEAMPTTGNAPGWLHRHRAELLPTGEIVVSGGTVVAAQDGELAYNTNLERFSLNLATGAWNQLTP